MSISRASTPVFIAGCLYVLLFGLNITTAQEDAYLAVTGPCDLRFPADHGPHPGFRTEWWYYTGNLQSQVGRRYGFQLTFFRSQISPSEHQDTWPSPRSAWRTQQIILAHAALTDVNAKRHLQAERLARSALGMAAAEQTGAVTSVTLGNWQLFLEPDSQRLRAATDEFAFDLHMTPAKKPVLHGDAGYSRKGKDPASASCYYSFTRLVTSGTLTCGDHTAPVEGLAWMDHEFSSAPLEADLEGWDWFSLQLSDLTELMVYLLRQKNGKYSSASAGTFMDAAGQTVRLNKDAIKLDILKTWKSPHSDAVYPAGWRLQVPALALNLTITPKLADQEMQTPQSTDVTYWEGSVSATGSRGQKPLTAEGYVELTGYAKAFEAPM